MCLLLVTRYPADLEVSFIAASEEGASIALIVSDPDVEADWDSADLTGGPGL